MRLVSLLALSLAAGCGSSKPEDTALALATDTDTDADADSDADGDADTDAPTTTHSGQLVREGAAVVTDAFSGTEELIFTGDDGTGQVVCDIVYDVDSIAVRDDCSDCEWAFDVQTSNARMSIDVDGACLVAAGVDVDTVGDLDGQVFSYGYDPLYYGHAEVLMTDSGAGWFVGTYAFFDEASHQIVYTWQDGYRTY